MILMFTVSPDTGLFTKTFFETSLEPSDVKQSRVLSPTLKLPISYAYIMEG